MNNIDNIDNIRREAISQIKEKIKKNPEQSGYLHPCNKERQEDMKMLGFSSGYEFTHWMQQNGIMKNPITVERKYRDKCAQKLGFKNSSDLKKEWKHKTGRQLPMEFNEDCTSHFGEFTENLMIQTFADPVKMPYGNPGFDWICKEGYKIDNKGVCLKHSKEWDWSTYAFDIGYNDITDWFILSAWDNRECLNPLHVWAFQKNDIVRGRKFCEFACFSITNTPKKLKELEKYEIANRLDKLKELCNRKKEYDIKVAT